MTKRKPTERDREREAFILALRMESRILAECLYYDGSHYLDLFRAGRRYERQRARMAGK